jgi:hypothetical protein
MAGKGGKREGAGRKTKAEELGLSELMDSIGPTLEVLQELYRSAVGMDADEEKGTEAVKPNIKAQELWLAYKFGKPNQTVKVDQSSGITIKYDGGVNNLIGPTAQEPGVHSKE